MTARTLALGLLSARPAVRKFLRPRTQTSPPCFTCSTDRPSPSVASGSARSSGNVERGAKVLAPTECPEDAPLSNTEESRSRVPGPCEGEGQLVKSMKPGGEVCVWGWSRTYARGI